MSPLFKLVLLVVIGVAVWLVVTRVMGGRTDAPVRFTPVEDLSVEVQQTIDAALARGELVAAVKHYRAATGASLLEAKTAVDTRRWKQQG